MRTLCNFFGGWTELGDIPEATQILEFPVRRFMGRIYDFPLVEPGKESTRKFVFKLEDIGNNFAIYSFQGFTD